MLLALLGSLQFLGVPGALTAVDSRAATLMNGREAPAAASPRLETDAVMNAGSPRWLTLQRY